MNTEDLTKEYLLEMIGEVYGELRKATYEYYNAEAEKLSNNEIEVEIDLIKAKQRLALAELGREKLQIYLTLM